MGSKLKTQLAHGRRWQLPVNDIIVPRIHDHDINFYDPRTERYILQRVMRSSVFFRENPCRKLPHFSNDEVQLGDELGSGEFGRVYEITAFRNKPPKTEDKPKPSSQESSSSWPSSSLIFPPGNKNHGPSGLCLSQDGLETPLSWLDVSEYGYFDDTLSDLDIDDIECGDYLHCDENDASTASSSREGDSGRMYMTQNVCRQGKSKYAVKTIRLDIAEGKNSMAIYDTALELKLLSALSHPNIIKVRGIMGHISSPENFGIIMDRLSATIAEKIDHWSSFQVPVAESPKGHRKWWPWLRKDETPNWNGVFLERVMAVFDTARAMRYLHQKRIIFRDLKPNNVGVTLRGDFVIFDFGLAKELCVSDLRVAPDGYKATGLTGSRMFMAPEVAKCKVYGFSADVFSFAILFWEVLALQAAFPDLSLTEHYDRVILGGERPEPLTHLLPPSLEAMMEASWSEDPSTRPTFESICRTLQEEIKGHAGPGLKEEIDGRSAILRLKSLESKESLRLVSA